MGFLGELKKLFWASSSVAKSAADKGFDKMKDVGEDVLEKSTTLGSSILDKAEDFGEDLIEKSTKMGKTLKEKAEDLGEDILEKSTKVGSDLRHRAEDLGGDLIEKSSQAGAILKDKAGHLGDDIAEKTGGLRDAILHSAEGTMGMVNKSETLKKAASATERIGEKVLSKGEELMGKGEHLAESIGSKILGKNHENVDKLKDFTEDLGSKVKAAKDSLVEKAGDVLEDIDDKIDETLARGKRQDAEEAANPTPDLQDILDKNQGSMLEGKDDFFTKAEAYAKGDYHGAQVGKVTIEKADEIIKKAPAVAAGFTDHDGDGNEMIDDAIIEDIDETGQDAVASIDAAATKAVDTIKGITAESEEE